MRHAQTILLIMFTAISTAAGQGAELGTDVTGQAVLQSASAPAEAEAEPAAKTQARPQYWFGVAVESIPSTMSRLLKLKPKQGLLVVAVAANSPAARAGVQSDDLLIEMDGKLLSDQRQLLAAASSADGKPAGSHWVLIRDGDMRTTEVTPEQRPPDKQMEGESALLDPTVDPDTRRVALGNKDLLVGPGIIFKLDSVQDVRTRQALYDGKTITITERSTQSGQRRTTIAMDGKVYDVTPETLGDLPDALRPIGKQLVGGMAVQTRPAESARASDRAQLEKRIDELERELRELKASLAGASTTRP